MAAKYSESDHDMDLESPSEPEQKIDQSDEGKQNFECINSIFFIFLQFLYSNFFQTCNTTSFLT